MDFLGTCFGGAGLGHLWGRGSCKRPRPMVNLGGTQKVDFLGICFGGEGLGLNSWAMISFMGRRAPQHGVHARDDVRWSIWDKKPRSTHARSFFSQALSLATASRETTWSGGRPGAAMHGWHTLGSVAA